MKRYVLFFISMVVLLGIIFVNNTINLENSKKVLFSESGYILNGGNTKYYFSQESAYTKSYDNKIVFNDTEGTKITIDNNNFLHYTSGNIVALQDSVLLDLNNLNSDPIIYYNVKANKEVKKISNRYTVKNLDSDIQFDQAIWKISANKYIILSDNLTISMNNGEETACKGYLEIEYFDNEIVNIYNEEVNFQTISSNAIITFKDNIKLNLGNKIVSQNDVNKMSLENMVINSDDNVTLVDLTEEEENKDENEEDENTVEEVEEIIEENVVQNPNQETVVTTTTTDVNNDSTTTVVKKDKDKDKDKDENDLDKNNVNTTNTTDTTNTTNTLNNNQTNSNTTNSAEEDGKIVVNSPDIVYEYVSENESKVDKSIALKEPKFKFEDMEITAVGLKGQIQIEDEDDLLDKEENLTITITNSFTGSVVYTAQEPYGTFNIPVTIETLIPNTQYTLLVTGSYIMNDNKYSKNFMNKTFVTTPIGLEVEKDYFTDDTLCFEAIFSDLRISEVEFTLLDKNGIEIPNRTQTIKNNGEIQQIEFGGLNPDTEYRIKLTKIVYDGMPQEGSNWVIEATGKTLKQKASINKLNYSINKRDGTFTLYIEDVKDPNLAITNYRYEVFKFNDAKDEEGNVTSNYDLEKIVYERETTDKEIKIEVANEEDGEGLLRNQYYGFRVIATVFDNEKYVEVESDLCGAFSLNGSTFPVVKFERLKNDYPPTEIDGFIYIIDNDSTILIDKDNPLTITYYSDVDESVIYRKFQSKDEGIEKTTDNDGNDVLKIAVDIGAEGSEEKGLKEKTSYTFSVHASIDLKDGNEVYKNAYIGSCIVTTEEYHELEVELTSKDVETNSFTVELSLDGDNISKEGLSSLNIMVYEGSGDINKTEYEHWILTLTNQNYATAKGHVADKTKEVNSLQDLVFDNSLIITPSFIGGGSESKYTELNYQVIVTATIDGTAYSNKIPVKSAEDGNDDTGDTTYIDNEKNETYSAAYIIVNGKGTTSEIDQKAQEFNIVAIENKNAEKNGLYENSELNDNTIVGYSVGTNFSNSGSLTAKKITYYVWDKAGNPVYDEKGEQLTKTVDILRQEEMPSVVFELGAGTIENPSDKFVRGGGYIFSYTITYEDTEGKDMIWPTVDGNEEEKASEKILMSEIFYPNKQEPTFITYPEKSDENSITFCYLCKDYDKALEYTENNTDEANLIVSKKDDKTINKNIQISTDGNLDEFYIDELQPNYEYDIKYKSNENPAETKDYQIKDLTSQFFDGKNNGEGINISEVTYSYENDPNNIKIYFDGNDAKRIAAGIVTLTNSNKSLTTNIIPTEDIDNRIFINVNLLELVDKEYFKDIIYNELSLSVDVFYDDGVIGFNPESEGKKYSTFIDENNEYLTIESGNKFVKSNSIEGNLFSANLSEFSENETFEELNLKNIDEINNETEGSRLELQFSPNGFKQNDLIIVQKQLDERMLEYDEKININDLRLGIKVSQPIKATLSTAEIQTEIINPMDIHVQNYYVEIWHSDDKNADSNWNDKANVEIRKIESEDIENFTLKNLSVSKYYKIRFKYKIGEEEYYTDFYDIETKKVGQEYEFETLAEIGIDNVKVEYEAEKYNEKYLKISYDINSDKSVMYQKMKYTFYELDDEKQSDNNKQIKLTEENIKEIKKEQEKKDEYKIDEDGSLIVTNGKFETEKKFSNVVEYINISPTANVFTFGKKYILKMVPYIDFRDDENSSVSKEPIIIETIDTEFELKSLKTPAIGLKMVRNQKSDNKYINVSISINDRDKIIYGKEYGEYELHIYKYSNNIKDNEKMQEVNYYTSQNSESPKDEHFDLQNNAQNYKLYIKSEDVDIKCNYMAVIKLKYDLENKAQNENDQKLELHEVKYILNAINNNAGISLGSTLFVGIKGNGLETRFYDSYYNIQNINKIEYSVFNISNSYSQSGNFTPDWSLASDEDDGISYYKIETPIKFDKKGVYTIQMNLYSNNELIGQIDSTYIYD